MTIFNIFEHKKYLKDVAARHVTKYEDFSQEDISEIVLEISIIY